MHLHPDRYTTSGVSIRKLGVVIHTNEGPDSSGPGLDAYMARPGDRPLGTTGRKYGSGYHARPHLDGTFRLYADATAGPYAAPPCNKTWWHIVIPGYARQTRAEWLDDSSRGFLRGVAAFVLAARAQDGLTWPLAVVDAAGLRHGLGGITSHDSVSKAWQQSDHWDPGPHFPWDVLLADIAELSPPPPTPDPDPIPEEETDMLAIYRPTFATPAGYDPAWFAVFASGIVRRATNPDVELARRLGLPTLDLDSADQYGELLFVSESPYPGIPA
jgi:hypothetical protein